MPAEKYHKELKTEPIWNQQKEIRDLHHPDVIEQKCEPDAAYRAFLIYRHLPDEKRTLLECARAYSQDESISEVPSSVTRLSKAWHWEMRVEAYYRHLQEHAAQKHEDAILKIQENIQQIALALSTEIRELVLNGMDSEEAMTKAKKKREKLEMFLGKGQMGKWLMQAHTTLLGTKIVVGSANGETPKVIALEWKP